MVYTAPGVYVVEDDRTPMPLTGVATGIPCFFGFTHQGPHLKPTRVQSLTEFNAIFGPRVMNKTVFPHAYVADSVYGFFLNGGSVCYVCRVNGGDSVTWPVRQIEDVVDYADLQNEFSTSTVSDPKYLGLTIEAASPGSWANNLLVKCTPLQQGDGLPMIDDDVAVFVNSLPGAPTAVKLDRLDAAGSVPLPDENDLVDAKCKLRFAVADAAVEGAWVKASGSFDFAGKKLPTTTRLGTLVFDNGTTAIDVPVKYSPDAAFDPTLIKRKPDGSGDAVASADFNLWNAATRLRFEGITIKDEADKTTKTGLVGSWSAEDQKFYFVTTDGNPVVLNKLTIAANLTAGVLTLPLNLKVGDTLTFRVDVLEPVPPRQPGQPITYRTLESYPGLSSVPGAADYFMNEGLVNGVSSRIRLNTGVGQGKALVFGETTVANTTKITPSAVGARAENKGTDAAPAATDYIKYFPLLKQVNDVSLVACPDVYARGVGTKSFTYQPILQALVDYCENNRCMAVIDAPPQPPVTGVGQMNTRVSNLNKFVSSYRSSYAAVYSPWLVVPNSSQNDPERTTIVPPSGYLLGIYNQSDNGEGVWAAPANISVKGPVGLNLPFTEDDSSQLNPAGVNLVRAFSGQGILVWGARTTTLNVMWQYVNVRRLFLYVERTLQQQTQWAVFEPNTRRTWNTLVNTAENFLRQIWLDGGLAGDSPEQAFRVQCGVPETMTQTDVDTGLLKVDIAIAPVKPAEFVVFTISQLVQTAV